MADREQYMEYTVSMKLPFPYKVDDSVGQRFAPIPTPIRRYGDHLPRSNRGLLGLFVPPP